MQNRIELVIVAAGAAVGHAKEGRADRVGDVVQDFLPALHQIAGVALVRIVAVETGGDARLGSFGLEFVAGDLLLHEAVVGLVLR